MHRHGDVIGGLNMPGGREVPQSTLLMLIIIIIIIIMCISSSLSLGAYFLIGALPGVACDAEPRREGSIEGLREELGRKCVLERLQGSAVRGAGHIRGKKLKQFARQSYNRWW